MRMLSVVFLLAIAAFSGPYAPLAYGFGESAADCAKCHFLDIEEASGLVAQLDRDVQVTSIRQAEVGGLWEVVYRKKGQRGILYIDYSKTHIVIGKVLDVLNRENLTEKRLYEISRIDPSLIPLGDALRLGRADAEYKLIVFDDPD